MSAAVQRRSLDLWEAENHRPCRPAWICAVDAAAWPCPTAREALIDAHRIDPDALSSHLSALLRQAASDLRPADPAHLYPRFIAWALSSDRACRLCGRSRHDAIPGVPPRLLPCEVANRLGTCEESGSAG